MKSLSPHKHGDPQGSWHRSFTDNEEGVWATGLYSSYLKGRGRKIAALRLRYRLIQGQPGLLRRTLKIRSKRRAENIARKLKQHVQSPSFIPGVAEEKGKGKRKQGVSVSVDGSTSRPSQNGPPKTIRRASDGLNSQSEANTVTLPLMWKLRALPLCLPTAKLTSQEYLIVYFS